MPTGHWHPSELAIVRANHARGRPGLSLAEFVSAGWDTVEPATPLSWNWHLDFLCYHLEAQLRGPHDAKRDGVVPSLCPYTGKPWVWTQNQLINVPPGTMKSLIVSVFAPAWMWLWRPSWRAIFASSNDTVSNRDSMKCRALLESDWYQKTFKPTWRLSDDQNAKTLYGNTVGGYRRATTTERKVVGERADALFIDDPHDAAKVMSKAERDATRDWYTQGYRNRVAQPETSTRTCIMQRLHEEDLSAFLLEEGWSHVCLPMEYELEGAGAVETFLGARDPRTAEGQLLFPARFPTDVLFGKGGTSDKPTGGEKKTLGSAGYAGQNQQRPSTMAGNHFKRNWWRFYRGGASCGTLPRPKGTADAPAVELPGGFDEVIGSWDCSFKGTDGSDFVVGLVVGRLGADKYVLARVRERMGFAETKEAIVKMRDEWPEAYEICIEDAANGTAIIETLNSEIAGIVAVKPLGGKESRAAAIEPQIEAGNVYLPEGAWWLDEWIDEFAAFPKGKHDDQVDSLSQGLIKMFDEDLANARALLGMVG